MNPFTPFMRLFSAADYAIQVVENTTKAAAIASESLIIVAETFNTEQLAILEEKRKELDIRIANGDFSAPPPPAPTVASPPPAPASEPAKPVNPLTNV